MNTTKGSEHIKAFMDWLTEAKRDYNIAVEDERDANAEQQDILHSIELEDHDQQETVRLTEVLKATRQRRREAKKQIERLRPVWEFVKYKPDIIRAMQKFLGDVRYAERLVENRSYTYRTDIVARTLREAGDDQQNESDCD